MLERRNLVQRLAETGTSWVYIHCSVKYAVVEWRLERLGNEKDPIRPCSELLMSVAEDIISEMKQYLASQGRGTDDF